MILATALQSPGIGWVQEPMQIKEGTEEHHNLQLVLCIFQTEEAK